jgi:hypothetical protein
MKHMDKLISPSVESFKFPVILERDRSKLQIPSNLERDMDNKNFVVLCLKVYH